MLILGAGMAGVSAAKVLSDAGCHDYILIEASDRVGGRCMEASVGDYTVEMGASWITGTYAANGQGRNNPIFDLALKYNLAVTSADYDMMVKNSTGHNITLEATPRLLEALSLIDFASQMSYRMQTENNLDEPDFNLKAAFRKYNWYSDTPLDRALEFILVDSVIGHLPESYSLKYYYDWSYYEYEAEDLLVTQQGEGGYSKIPKYLLDETLSGDESRVYLNSYVTKIEGYNDTKVTVTTSDGRQFVGDYVIMTFGLGVLQHQVVEFSPPLPQWKLKSIDEFAVGHHTHFYMRFPSQFWDDYQFTLYAGQEKGYFPVWQNMNRNLPGSNILRAFVSGEHTLWLNELTDSEIQEKAMGVLRIMYGPDIPDPDEFLFPRLAKDPRHFGTYSYWPPGYPGWQHELLGDPLDRLYFAGEAYHYTDGYVHGAFLSGEATGMDVVECLKGQCPEQRSYKPPYKALGCTDKTAINYDQQAKVDDGTCQFK